MIVLLSIVTAAARAADAPGAPGAERDVKPERTDSQLAALLTMARIGTPALALSRLDEAQPGVDTDAAAWARWERERIEILGRSEAWQRALDRLRQTPDAAPAGFQRWARERRAAFHLELGQAAPASKLLRGLLWRDGPRASAAELERWRRLVIRAHLAAGRVEDAITAMRRFEQDYGNGADDGPRDGSGSSWAALRTRVLLRAGHAAEAAARLPQDPTGELAVLATLARARAGQLDAEQAYQRAVEAAEAEGTTAAMAARWWFVAADVAARAGHLGRRALATEQALAHADALPAGDGLFALDGGDLWAAWLAYGRQAGNSQQLLIGDDDAWFAAAKEALSRTPVLARALLAVVAQQGSPEARPRAHRRLLARLEQHGPGLAVARQAYLNAGRYPRVAAVPAAIRYRLVDDALARNDLALAGRLMFSLTAAPPGVESFAWDLLRARVLTRGERYNEAAAVLARIIAAHPGLHGDRLDRLLQVVFDLQGAGQHERALVLLKRLAWPGLPVQRRRELLYWQAQSYGGLEQYREAAALYLRSALLGADPPPGAQPGMDPWGQAARYQAAAMLAEAGLVGDARRLYRELLHVAANADRRATLRHRLRQLPATGTAPDDIPAGPRSRE